MSLANRVIFNDNFLGNRSFSNATAEAGTGLYAHIVKTSGSPTIATATGSTVGGLVFTTDATNEIQKLEVDMGDVLCFGVNNIQSVRITFSLSGITANSTAYLGVGGAYNATASSIVDVAWAKIANATVTMQSNNGSATTSAGQTVSIVATTVYTLRIDFTYGTKDVRFYLDTSSGSLGRISGATTFDMSALASTISLQPILRVEKAASTDVPILTVYNVEVEAKR